VTDYLRGATAIAETEFPTTKATDRDGWTEVSDTYQAPVPCDAGGRRTTPALAANAEARWGGVTLAETEAPKPRTVRLATVHFRPQGGKTPMTIATCTSR